MKKTSPLLLTSIYAYDNSTNWKLDEDGNMELKDGNPIYIDGSGREMVVKGDTISNLNAEARSHRKAKEDAEAKLKVFDGLDADEAHEAIKKLQDVDFSKLVDAGKIDEVKAEITSQFQGEMQTKDESIASLQQQLDQSKINDVFKGSKFVRDNIAVPQDMFEATFRGNFKVKDGKVEAYDSSGNRLNSKENLGEFAGPEEALQLLVDAHPQKDTILKADTGNGTGSNGGGSNRPGGRVIKRADFAKLTPAKQAEISQKATSGEMKIVD